MGRTRCKAAKRPNSNSPVYIQGFSPNDAGETGYIGLSEVWTTYAYDEHHKTKPKPGSSEPPMTLQAALAHEVDHLLGFRHSESDPGAWYSPHTASCGGLC